MTVTASTYERKANELYETEAWATRALLSFIPMPRFQVVWEPAAGNHKMVDVLRACGWPVISSDLETYGREHDFVGDFLLPAARSQFPYDHIVTNPPYGRGNRMAVKFCELALERCRHGWVAMLLTAKFDFGKTRTHLFRDNPRYAGKIALLDRIQWFPGEMGGSEDHAWFYWAPEGVEVSRTMHWAHREPYDQLWDEMDLTWLTTTS